MINIFGIIQALSIYKENSLVRVKSSTPSDLILSIHDPETKELESIVHFDTQETND